MFHEQSFLEYLSRERRLSPHTHAAYARDLGLFVEFMVDRYALTAVQAVGHIHIRAWTVHLLGLGNSPRSINRRLSCLKTYFRFVKREGLLTDDPMRKVVSPKVPRRLPVSVPESGMRLALEALSDGTDFQGLRDRLMLEMLYGAGLRRAELSGLRMGDIDEDRGLLRVMGKGGKVRMVPLGPWLIRLLRLYMEVRSSTHPGAADRVFLSNAGTPMTGSGVYYVVRKHLSVLGNLEQRSPHVLRHAFATHLSEKGAPLNDIKTLLGHSSLAATQVYLHNSIERLKSVYRQAHPGGEEE
jgi:integrase/recombinase XerC